MQMVYIITCLYFIQSLAAPSPTVNTKEAMQMVYIITCLYFIQSLAAPSPTVNTKEAMQMVMGMFNASLEIEKNLLSGECPS